MSEDVDASEQKPIKIYNKPLFSEQYEDCFGTNAYSPKLQMYAERQTMSEDVDASEQKPIKIYNKLFFSEILRNQSDCTQVYNVSWIK